AVAFDLPARNGSASAAGGGPLFQMGVAQSPLLQLPDSPIAGRAELRRVGEARAVAVREVVHDVHDLASVGAGPAAKTASAAAEFGGFDFVDYVKIYFFLRQEGRGNGQQQQSCRTSEG